MNWITDNIAIGNLEDAMDLDLLRVRGITAILALNHFPTHTEQSTISWHRIQIIDGKGNDIQTVMQAIKMLNQLVSNNKVLVHCTQGASRSPFIVACYLSAIYEISFTDAIEYIRQKRTQTQIDQNLLDMYPLVSMWNRNNE